MPPPASRGDRIPWLVTPPPSPQLAATSLFSDSDPAAPRRPCHDIGPTCVTQDVPRLPGPSLIPPAKFPLPWKGTRSQVLGSRVRTCLGLPTCPLHLTWSPHGPGGGHTFCLGSGVRRWGAEPGRAELTPEEPGTATGTWRLSFCGCCPRSRS